MYIQGDLQLVFDALYNLGVIDPVLELDWSEALEEIDIYSDDFDRAVRAANESQTCLGEMIKGLEKFDDSTLNYLAMEVAKEFADFHSREGTH